MARNMPRACPNTYGRACPPPSRRFVPDHTVNQDIQGNSFEFPAYFPVHNFTEIRQTILNHPGTGQHTKCNFK